MHPHVLTKEMESRYPGCCNVHQYMLKFLSLGIRTDGRAYDQVRPLALNVGSTSADGSALVRAGDTVVICGIKLEVVPSPGSSVLVCNVDCASCCLPEATSGAPSSQVQALSEQLQLLLSQYVNFEEQVMENSEYSCVVNVDVVCLSHHGNLFDMCVLAAVAALQNTTPLSMMKLPGNVLPLSTPILAVSFALFDGHFLLDPTLEEERHGEGHLTICIDGGGQLRHIQHTGHKITEQDIAQLSQLAMKRVTILNELLQTSKQTVSF